jgi:hypothetical protein
MLTLRLTNFASAFTSQTEDKRNAMARQSNSEAGSSSPLGGFGDIPRGRSAFPLLFDRCFRAMSLPSGFAEHAIGGSREARPGLA